MKKITELCELGFKYKTDKSPLVKHTYTPEYYELFQPIRKKVKKVLEMGIGTPVNMKHSSGSEYVVGASLRMWRDFFPNAIIYGADIEPSAMFKDKRIKTFLCDQMNKEDLINLVEKTGDDIDIFIDDGAHYIENQVFLCKTMMPLLKRGAMYFIEDVYHPRKLRYELKPYDCREINENQNGVYRDWLVQVKWRYETV
jgi:hypothetical protein